MWSRTAFVLALLVVAEAFSLDVSSSAGRAGARHLLQTKTKLVTQPPGFMAGIAAACPATDTCPDLKINLSYDSNKKSYADLVATGTFQFRDPTGATGMLGGSCTATAKIPFSDGTSKPITAVPTVLMGKGAGPKSIKEIRAELRWSTSATCVANSLAPPPVPSTNLMYYFGTVCQVVLFEYNSAVPGKTCNHYYEGRTYAEVGYDEKQPPNNKQSSKAQVWYCKDVRYITGDCMAC